MASLSELIMQNFKRGKLKNLKNGPWDNDGRRQIYEKAELKKKPIFNFKKNL